MFGERDSRFFHLFEETANNLSQAAKVLLDLTHSPQEKESLTHELETLEHRGDELTHDIIAELNRAFITPIDREDIFLIAKEMDNILDAMEATAHRFVMFSIDESTEASQHLAKLIVAATAELTIIMQGLRKPKLIATDNKSVVEINRLENEGDQIYRRKVTELFSGKYPTIEVVKWRELYDHFENTLDALEDVANIVEGIAMKHS
ncbi:MAG TPA: DUF47 family protein [Bacillota bacterium]|nr:DUF47 family protein [Bacillota bacterium]